MSTTALILDPSTGEPTWTYQAADFAAAVARSNLSLEEIAQLGGFSCGSHVQRVVGVKPWPGKRHGAKKYADTWRTTVRYEDAARLAKALNLDLVEWGI